MSAPSSRLEIESRLIAKAWTDPDFKGRLLTDPKGTVEGELGTTLQPDLRLNVVEENSHRLYLLLPAKPPGADRLSIEELRAIASGDGESPFAPRTLE